MHYYQFNINDYRGATSHLSNEEDLAYRRLIEMYYDTEQPIPLDLSFVSRRIRIEPEIILAVLEDFFQRSEEGWVNKRAEREIIRYHEKKDTASRAGKASAERRVNRKTTEDQRVFNECSTTVQPTNNHKPITNNQEPIKNNMRLKALSRPPDVQESVWEDFCQHPMRAAITQTALDGIEREAKKAGWTLEAALSECVLRGWRGFKADWVNSAGKSNVNRQEALEARNKAIGDAWLAQESEIES